MPTLQDDAQSALTTATGHALEQQQRRRMLTALALLTVALILVLIKDWRVLSPPPAAAPEAVEPEAAPPAPAQMAKTAAPATPAHATTEAARAKKAPAPIATAKAEAPPMVVTTNRAVLPPLEVEVVAGNQRHTVDAGTNSSVSVRMQEGLPPLAANGQPQATDTAANAGERVQLSQDTLQLLDRPVQPSYPMLAKQMKVQGAVILEALIGKSGEIQEIQVLSGPAILSAAAREAVRQWRFKPHLQSGKPVETEARITVNFTISTY